MKINADPKDQTNDCDSFFVITRGSFQALIGDGERTVREG
jgi:hypothetical protein